MAEGRAILRKDDTSQTVNEDSKARLRAQIGSRPPRCEGRCSSCGPCEAIQVPTYAQANQVRETLPQLYPALLMPEEMRIQATTSP
ncbi:hypothetical protein M0R45_004765 [Rubus argutus]|uniref:Epidermal patterning factor-like protein n=1 Tax=Rubus argutus TaxID=59490 RepID=A0AAW1YKT6_RUBAR